MASGNRHYDIVIIGAGPAGMACGISLKQRQANVCAIDRSIFPRPKTCAGLVTQKTFELLETLMLPSGTERASAHMLKKDCGSLEDLFCDRALRVQLFQRSRSLVSAEIDPHVRLVNRSDFDYALVRRYLELGGELLQGERSCTINYEACQIRLGNGEVLHYNNLVFADGALSQSRKLPAFRSSSLAFGIEAHIPLSELPPDFPADIINLYFGYTKSGYIWAFPHGATVCIGAVEHYQKGLDYRDILIPFWKDHGIDPDRIRYTGAMLPYGQVVLQEALPENVFLVGDAAGLADPISGEGLYMALFSGMQAARAWTESQAAHPAQTIKSRYLKSIRPLTQIVREGRSLQRFFYRPEVQKIFLEKASGNPRFITFFFRHQVAFYEYRYRRMLRLYLDYKKSKSRTDRI